MTPLPVTQSYIFHPREQTIPIVSMTGNPEYFYDDKIGILVAAHTPMNRKTSNTTGAAL